MEDHGERRPIAGGTQTSDGITVRASLARALQEFGEKVTECPHDRAFWVYIRKSNTQLERSKANYLAAQLDLGIALRNAGVSDDMLVEKSDDSGKSGALSMVFGKDLADMYSAMPEGRVGTVVTIDVARLFRDYTYKEPARVASRMQRYKIHVITRRHGHWLHLDMAKATDYDLFIEMARDAAKERLSIRDRTMTARESLALGGGYTGRLVPFGWAVKPKIAATDTVDDYEQPGYMYPYAPHAELKLEIMRVSLRYEISSTAALHRYLVKHQMKVPPFDPSIRSEAFRRSNLSRAGLLENGRKRKLRDDDYFYPSARMLENILIEPMAIGLRLYGSGAAGKWKLGRLERMYGEQDQSHDSLIKDYREYLGTDPQLAICTSEEEIDLFWAVHDKWSPVDLRKALACNFQEEPRNEKTQRRTGRPLGSFTKYGHPWGQKIVCLHHGQDATGEFRRDYSMRFSRADWTCMRAYEMGDQPERFCASFGDDNKLGRVLAFHLLHVLWTWLVQDERLFQNLKEQRQLLRREIEELQKEIRRLRNAYDEAVNENRELSRNLRRANDPKWQELADEDFDRRVQPVLTLIRTKEADLEAARGESDEQGAEHDEEVIRQEIRRIVESDKLPEGVLRELVATFVESVGVLIPEMTGEVVIEFRWSKALVDGHGRRLTDTLITWKNLSKDLRPWTPDEDAALRVLYPISSGASYWQIRERLQPGRRIDAIVKRVYALGVRRPGRGPKWVKECRRIDQTWGQQHPEVLYLCLPQRPLSQIDLDRLQDHGPEGDWADPMVCELRVGGEGVREMIELPHQVRQGLLVHKTYWNSCAS